MACVYISTTLKKKIHENKNGSFGWPFDYYGDSQKSITVSMCFKRVSSKNKVPYLAMITFDVSKYCLRLENQFFHLP